MPTQNPAEFTERWMKSRHMVAAFIRSLVRDEHHAEDILQKVAVAAATNFEQYDRDREFAHWLIGIAKRQVAQHFREAQRMQCMSNQRSWGVAMLAYNTDNKDTYPVLDTAPHNPWYSLFGKQTAAGTMPLEERPLNDYVNDAAEAALCPDDRGQASTFAGWENGSGKSIYDQLGFSYAFAQNSDLFGIQHLVKHGAQEPVKISDLNGPPSTKFLMSEYNYFPNRPWAIPVNRWHDFKSSPAPTRQSVTAFADGHAEYLVFPEDWESRGTGYPVDPTSELW